VANNLANQNKVARQLENKAARAAVNAARQAAMNPTQSNVNAAQAAQAAANAARQAALSGNAGVAAVQFTNAQRAAGPQLII
jgi:hypothetical protein